MILNWMTTRDTKAALSRLVYTRQETGQKNFMELSLRMRAIATFAKEADIVADIGCDHGFVTAALIEDYGAKQVIACDISEKSLQKAKKLVWEHNLVQSVDFYVADGLSALTDKPPDCVIIAGMGGLLIRDILERNIKTAKRAQKLVLAPQGNEYELRTFLYENGFMIYDEAIVYDEGKYYQVIAAREGKGICPEEIYLRYGYYPAKRGERLQKEFLQRKLLETEMIMEKAHRGKNTVSYKEKQELHRKIQEGLRCL